jgi:hypothetical protein
MILQSGVVSTHNVPHWILSVIAIVATNQIGLAPLMPEGAYGSCPSFPGSVVTAL